jgi:DNA-binding NtrC family response regulator
MTKTTRMGPGTGILGTDAGPTEARPVVVRVTTGKERGTEKRLESGTLSVGSSPDADLVLTDSTVSRYHAELALLAQGVRVKDLGSTNGTFVGDSRIEAAVVLPGAEVRVGRTRLEIIAADIPAPELPSELMRFGKLVGASVAMRRAFGQLDRAATGNARVWIFGETGTGKTEAARALHESSLRQAMPFVVVDLDPRMVPATLTDALEAAAGGTLVLERVDETTASVQDAVLRMLEARERRGIDVRLVTSSTRDPRTAVETGLVRRELFFHLGSLRIELPPLRERLEDLPRLVEAIASELGYPEVRLSSADLSALRGQALPGNVRELRRTIEETLLRAHAQRPSGTPVPALDESELVRMPFKEAKEKLLDAFERRYVEELLDRAGGNVSRAADEAGIDRNHLARLAKKHGLR